MGTKARFLLYTDLMKELLQKPFLPRRGWMMGREVPACVCVYLSVASNLYQTTSVFAYHMFDLDSNSASDKRGWTRTNYDSRDRANHVFHLLIIVHVCSLASQFNSQMECLLWFPNPALKPFRNQV